MTRWNCAQTARVAAIVLAFLSGIVYCAYVAYVTFGKPKPEKDRSELLACNGKLDFSDRIPVANNRGPEVPDGFQGEVHSLLRGASKFDVSAHWKIDPNTRFLTVAPPDVRSIFPTLQVSIPTRTYSARDFSRFLPANEPGAVGQMWALDQHMVAYFLTQFHPAPSMRLVAKGRRAGPDGAFAILRAVSPTHFDIQFRIHAEFDVLPPELKLQRPIPEAWYSPACFLGRILINRQMGTVDYFSLGLPTDSEFNVHVTHATGYPDSEAHDWMRIDRMELVGGNPKLAENVRWDDQLDTAEAQDRLAKVFFKFKQIDWVTFDKVQEIARVKKKPIFVVVALGALDNQTC